MNQQDFKGFSSAWSDAHEAMAAGKELSDSAISFCFEILIEHPLDSVLSAITKHARIERFAPTPSDIIRILESGNQRVSADEAWARSPKSEQDSAIVTAEMAAAYKVALPMIESGDMFNAGRAYKAAYARECERAESLGIKPTYSMSLGIEPTGRQYVIEEALKIGVIGKDQARAMLPSSREAGVIAGLLTGTVKGEPSGEELRKKWRDVKKSLDAGVERTERRIKKLTSELKSNPTPEAKRMYEAEFELLLISQANRQEAAAKQLQKASYEKAFEQSRAAAEVIFEKAMLLAKRKSIQYRAKVTSFRLKNSGTKIVIWKVKKAA